MEENRYSNGFFLLRDLKSDPTEPGKFFADIAMLNNKPIKDYDTSYLSAYSMEKKKQAISGALETVAGLLQASEFVRVSATDNPNNTHQRTLAERFQSCIDQAPQRFLLEMLSQLKAVFKEDISDYILFDNLRKLRVKVEKVI